VAYKQGFIRSINTFEITVFVWTQKYILKKPYCKYRWKKIGGFAPKVKWVAKD
jgi:hypothetical protein